MTHNQGNSYSAASKIMMLEMGIELLKENTGYKRLHFHRQMKSKPQSLTDEESNPEAYLTLAKMYNSAHSDLHK